MVANYKPNSTLIELTLIEQCMYFITFKFQKENPEPEPDISPVGVQSAQHLWKSAFVNTPSISLDMNNITSCIDSKARFTQCKYQGDQHATVEIFIR